MNTSTEETGKRPPASGAEHASTGARNTHRNGRSSGGWTAPRPTWTLLSSLRLSDGWSLWLSTLSAKVGASSAALCTRVTFQAFCVPIWNERSIVSVAILTRVDGEGFFPLAPDAKLRTETTSYPLERLNAALDDLRSGKPQGAAVLP